MDQKNLHFSRSVYNVIINTQNIFHCFLIFDWKTYFQRIRLLLLHFKGLPKTLMAIGCLGMVFRDTDFTT